jgi:penicillin-binding protein 1A
MNNGQSPRRSRNRRSNNVFTTKSGTDIRLNRSFADRRRAHKDAAARQRAARLSSLPSNRFKRVLYMLEPRRVAAYWFSREGAIMGLKITGVGIVVCFLLLVGLFAYFRKDLPNITDVNGNNMPGSVSYYDKTGQTLLWQDYDAVKRIPVEHDKISEYVKNATIAIEDKDFYKQGAFNVRGIMRAAYHDVRNQGGPVQGGSTITQQLVKLSENWTNERTISRKIKELILAVELERSYSKQDILTGYLNLAPYGGIEIGVESAARDYFGTTAKDLTLAQATFLAAIPQAPAYYSPYSDYFEKDDLIGRQHYILDRMVEQNMVTKKEADEAKKVDIVASVKPLQPKYQGIKAPYFVLAAKDELEKT